MQVENIKKQEVEELLKCRITDERFTEALEYAAKKQAYIYEREPREIVLQDWYLVQLTAEYVKSLAFSRFTMDLYRLHNTEKEHLFNEQGAPMDNPIVAVPAL